MTSLYIRSPYRPSQALLSIVEPNDGKDSKFLTDLQYLYSALGSLSSNWQFQEDGKESYPKAVRVPANPRGEIADRAFNAAPSLRHVEVAMCIQHAGFAAWQSCQQLQIVKLPPSVISLAEGTFQGCYVLREVAAPGCVQCSRRVFAECCSLGRVGVSHETDDSNVLAPGAQLDKYVFESCLTLTTTTFFFSP